MRVCKKCGCPIVYGVNGAMFLGDICYTCNGGLPRYPKPVVGTPTYSDADLDALEDRCLDMGEPVD